VSYLRPWFWIAVAFSLGWAGTGCRHDFDPAARTFPARGVIRELKEDGRTLIVRHETITNYMDAMTMPFRVRDKRELVGLSAGDEITFRLRVTEDESWIESLQRTGRSQRETNSAPATPSPRAPPVLGRHPLLDYAFTNEFGQPVSLGQFHGSALAYTFFFTRCPVPEYCPRLAKNFAAATRKLRDTPGAPTNWHFLSVSIDPESDTPAVLRNYARGYGYDSNRWSFLTGPTNKVRELAALSGLEYERDGASYAHGLLTVIIDPLGRLHKVFPIGGDLGDAIATEMLRAAAATNFVSP
jgi:protein SCO1